MNGIPIAGKPATLGLVDVPRPVTVYWTGVPDASAPEQRVVFGTSGHGGFAFENSFNERPVPAISQAICDYCKRQNIGGPPYLGIDAHALPMPACASALEMPAAKGVEIMLADRDEYTPTPVISHPTAKLGALRGAGPLQVVRRSPAKGAYLTQMVQDKLIEHYHYVDQ
jgi:phosphoglucomutase